MNVFFSFILKYRLWALNLLNWQNLWNKWDSPSSGINIISWSLKVVSNSWSIQLVCKWFFEDYCDPLFWIIYNLIRNCSNHLICYNLMLKTTDIVSYNAHYCQENPSSWANLYKVNSLHIYDTENVINHHHTLMLKITIREKLFFSYSY